MDWGLLHSQGRGVTINPEMAVQWYRRAAQQEHGPLDDHKTLEVKTEIGKKSQKIGTHSETMLVMLPFCGGQQMFCCNGSFMLFETKATLLMNTVL